MVPLHRTDWQPQGPPVATPTPAQGIMLGLSPWVPVQGPSYSTGPPLDKKNETVFLSELSATDGTTYD